MARASTPTLLSLDRYAKIMGISPAHFNQGSSDTLFAVKTNTCSDIWPQHSWQYNDHVSREGLARAIYMAEEQIARVMGFYPAPTWICQEVKRFDRHHRRDVWKSYARNVRGARLSVPLDFGKFIQAGQRNTAPVGTAKTADLSLKYDAAALTATIVLDDIDLTDACEIHVFFAGHSAAPEWEIRPANSASISNGTLTMVFNSWLFIKPELWEAYPTMDDFGTIDITETVTNLVASVEVHRVYNDFTQTSATFYWEPRTPGILTDFCTSCGGTSCPACSLTTQNGCLHVRDTVRGIVVPTPATYNSTTGQWDTACFTECRDPNEVKLYYYAGEYDNRWLCGDVCDPLSEFWAQPIAWMATARLDRTPCQCGTVQTQFDHLRTNLAAVGETSFQFDPDELRNPFGTRVGEVMAWRQISKISTGRRLKGGAV